MSVTVLTLVQEINGTASLDGALSHALHLDINFSIGPVAAKLP